MIAEPAPNKFSVEERNDDNDDNDNNDDDVYGKCGDDSKAGTEVTTNQDNDLSKAQVNVPQYTLNKKNLK